MPPNLKNVIYHSAEHEANDSYTNEEVDKMENYAPVEYSGLGFYYGDLPLNYKFHSDDMGEDFYFFKENHLELRLAKNIKLLHVKSIPLG